MRSDNLIPTRMPDDLRDSQRLLFIAKHAKWEGGLHPEDGNHALYHREIRQRCEDIGISLMVGDSYEVLFERPPVDFVFPLLNRGGFFNSELLLPVLCKRLGLPFLGASPILRGLADDKHLTKLEAAARAIPTSPWAIFRCGAPVDLGRIPPAQRWVIKPNNSSASWGVGDAHDLEGLEQAIHSIHALGHDVIVEPFISGSDVEVPVITLDGAPAMLPMMIFEQENPDELRTYEEKRDLVGDVRYHIKPLEDAKLQATIADYTARLVEVFRPFDYGRFEFRVDFTTGHVSLLEVNLNCNIWSEKLFARSAALAGFSHAQLIETILAESMMRQLPHAGSRVSDKISVAA